MEPAGGAVDAWRRFCHHSDRREAVSCRYLLQPGDLLLVAGKGHELSDRWPEQRHFDDREELRRAWPGQVTPPEPRSAKIAQVTAGRLSRGCVSVGISADSRSVCRELFVPLRGEKFDGHDFHPGCPSRETACLSET
jgi:UDP-N-acetylmuramyl tripeptide synthase